MASLDIAIGPNGEVVDVNRIAVDPNTGWGLTAEQTGYAGMGYTDPRGEGPDWMAGISTQALMAMTPAERVSASSITGLPPEVLAVLLPGTDPFASITDPNTPLLPVNPQPINPVPVSAPTNVPAFWPGTNIPYTDFNPQTGSGPVPYVPYTPPGAPSGNGPRPGAPALITPYGGELSVIPFTNQAFSAMERVEMGDPALRW